MLHPIEPLFLDRGYSHPNFEMRFLIMNYRLQPTDTARVLLEDFLAGRAERPTVGFGLSPPSTRPQDILGVLGSGR